MKEKILNLRSEGKTYNQIIEILGCSKGTIAYHCGEGQKEKTKIRRRKRNENILIKKIDNYRCRKNNVESIRKFQKRDNTKHKNIDKNITTSFTWNDVVSKFGENPICYLSGEQLNIYENTYQLDHIIPSSKNGNNSLENLGFLHKKVNQIKTDLTPDELIEWCVKILKHNGYLVTK